MKPKVDAVKNQLHKLKDEAYKKAIKLGNKNFKSKKYEDAWLNYFDALAVYEEKEYPKEQIELIKKILLENMSDKQAYNKAIKKADAVFVKKKWKRALRWYKIALLYKPKDYYALSRIDDINTILNYLKENPENSKKEQDVVANIIEKEEAVVDYNETKKSIKKIDTKINNDNDSIDNAKNYFDKGMLEYQIGEFDNAIDNMKQAASIYSDMGEKEAEADINYDIATVYDNTYDYAKAEEYYNKAKNLYSNINKKDKMAELYTELGNIKFNQGKYYKAIENYTKSKDIYTQTNDKKNIGNSFNYIGVAFFELEDYENALSNFNKSIEITGKNKFQREYSMTLNNVGNINYEKEELNFALDYYNKSIKVKKDIEFWKGVAVSMHNIGNVYRKMGENEKALDYYNKSNELADKTGFKQIAIKNYAALAELYAIIEDCQKSLEYYKMYTNSKHLLDDYRTNGQVSETNYTYSEKNNIDNEQISLLKQQISKQKLLMQLQNKEKIREIAILNKDKKLKELELKEQNAKVQRQRLFIIAGLILFIIFWIFFILLLRQIKQKRKINLELTDNQNQITDSLVYANRIQDAVLPPISMFDNEFKNYFIINKPRDIVSGDFYWLFKKNNKLAVAVGDCTGHGVPGGFLSMISITFLNEIATRIFRLNPSNILDELKKSIIKSLHQEKLGANNKDGLDIALCVIDKTTKTIEFSGAYNPLIIISSKNKINELEPVFSNKDFNVFEIKADRMPISVHYQITKSFTTTKINYTSGDRIFLFSDGIIDQFGGKKNKRFMKKNFIELLLNIQSNDIKKQSDLIVKAYENWKNNNEQIDDILVLGIELE